MKAILTAAVVATILTAAPASAGRYVILAVGPEDDGGMVAIDLDTIRPVGAWKRAWVLTAIAGRAYAGKPAYVQSLTEYDCREQRSQVLTKVIYDPATKAAVRNLSGETWSYPPPGTATAEAMDYACGKAAEPDTILELSASQLFAGFMGLTKEDRAAARGEK